MVGRSSRRGGTLQELKILEGAEEFALGEGPSGPSWSTASPEAPRACEPWASTSRPGPLGRGRPPPRPRDDLGGPQRPHRSRRLEEAVETPIDKLPPRHDEVFVVGLSFGGALSLDLAARHPDEVGGIVTLAGSSSRRTRGASSLRSSRSWSKSLPGVGNDICDPEGRTSSATTGSRPSLPPTMLKFAQEASGPTCPR